MVDGQDQVKQIRKAKPSAFCNARALIGWLNPADAKSALQNHAAELPDGIDAELNKIKERIAKRKCGADLYDSVVDAPATLQPYLQKMRENVTVKRLLDTGWDVKLVDLAKCTPYQAYVFENEHIDAKVAAVTNDPLALAEVTLSLSQRQDIPYRFDSKRRQFVFSSTDQNLRVQAEFQTALVPGVGTFGFVIGFSESMLRIALHKGRHIVVDGTHRASALLERGIRWVPALFGASNNLPLRTEPSMYVPDEMLFDERPPFMSDFINPDFHYRVKTPKRTRVITLQVNETSIFQYD